MKNKYINDYNKFINESIEKEYGLDKFSNILTKIIDKPNVTIWKIDKFKLTNDFIENYADLIKSSEDSTHIYNYINHTIMFLARINDKFGLLRYINKDKQIKLDSANKEYSNINEKQANDLIKKYELKLKGYVTIKDLKTYFESFITVPHFTKFTDYIEENVIAAINYFSHIDLLPLIKDPYPTLFRVIINNMKYLNEEDKITLKKFIDYSFKKIGKPFEDFVINNSTKYAKLVKYYPDKIRKELEHIEGLNDIGLF
jgi:hypothetical protein